MVVVVVMILVEELIGLNSVFCSALGATIVANIQLEIGSYFRAGSQVCLICICSFPLDSMIDNRY